MKNVHSLLAASFALALATGANAATIGAGVGTLGLAGANNVVDTSTDGTTDQSRQNVDISFTSTLGAGVHEATTWTFRAGQTGTVIPYLAFNTGPNTYEILAVGDPVVIDFAGLDIDMTVAFGGTDTFTLAADTVVYAGHTNPTGAGAQNPIYTNLNSGSFMDHDNNADGAISPAVVGGAVDGLGHTNLARSYAFSIETRQIPEPSAALFSLLGLLGVAFVGMRRRRG